MHQCLLARFGWSDDARLALEEEDLPVRNCKEGGQGVGGLEPPCHAGVSPRGSGYGIGGLMGIDQVQVRRPCGELDLEGKHLPVNRRAARRNTSACIQKWLRRAGEGDSMRTHL